MLLFFLHWMETPHIVTSQFHAITVAFDIIITIITELITLGEISLNSLELCLRVVLFLHPLDWWVICHLYSPFLDFINEFGVVLLYCTCVVIPGDADTMSSCWGFCCNKYIHLCLNHDFFFQRNISLEFWHFSLKIHSILLLNKTSNMQCLFFSPSQDTRYNNWTFQP